MVQRRHKDPGSPGKAQESQETEVVEAGAKASSQSRHTGKIRAEFAVSGRIGKFSAAIEAKKLFTQMIRVDPDIVFKSDSDGRITFRKISEFPTGENKFKEFFTVTPHTRNDGTGKIHINFQIESKKRLGFMKRDVTFFNYIRDNKIWLVEHKYETHELTSIGFIVKKSPTLTNRPQLESDIGEALNEYMKSAIEEGDVNGISLDGREFTPTLEIGNKNVVHVLRDGSTKTGIMETQALEIRCERSKAITISKLLCAAELPENKFGTFVPYGMAKTENDVYKKMINEQNKFLTDVTVIPVFGLHRDVIGSVMPGYNEDQDDDTMRNQLLEVEVEAREAADNAMTADVENVFLAIEPTQRTDDLGKWFFLTKKRNKEYANRFIDEFVIAKGSALLACKDHVNDGDSFKQGIRRANTPSTAFKNYAEALRNSAFSDDDVQEQEGQAVHNPYGTKKRKQIIINFEDKEDFPALKTKSGNSANNGQKKSTATKSNTTQKTSAKKVTVVLPSQQTPNNGRVNNDSEYIAEKNAMQAQIDWLKMQITAMQAKQDEALSKVDEQMTRIEEQGRKTEERQAETSQQFSEIIVLLQSRMKEEDKREDKREREVEEARADRARRDFAINQCIEENAERFENFVESLRTNGRQAFNSRKREATDALQQISASMEVQDANDEGFCYEPHRGINLTTGQVIEGEAEATQPLANNE